MGKLRRPTAEFKRGVEKDLLKRYSQPVFPNFIKDLTVTFVNQVWLAGITYVWILTGFVYLVVVLDLFS